MQPAFQPVQSATSTDGSIAVERLAACEFRVVAAGAWTPGYADRHFADLDRALAAARGAAPLRILVDLRAAAVQSPETAARITYWTREIYRADDRVALLVANSLVKLQMRATVIIATHDIFISEKAAALWLAAG